MDYLYFTEKIIIFVHQNYCEEYGIEISNVEWLVKLDPNKDDFANLSMENKQKLLRLLIEKITWDGKNVEIYLNGATVSIAENFLKSSCGPP